MDVWLHGAHESAASLWVGILPDVAFAGISSGWSPAHENLVRYRVTRRCTTRHGLRALSAPGVRTR